MIGVRHASGEHGSLAMCRSQREATVNEAGDECVFVRLDVPLDVPNEDDWPQHVATGVSRFGMLDVLVSTAGVSSTGGIDDLTAVQWDRTLNINCERASEHVIKKEVVPEYVLREVVFHIAPH